VATTDLHQHLWPEALLALLERRSAPPRLRRDAGGLILELAGEPPAAFSPAAHDPVARAAMAVADGIDRVVVAPSSPLGIESLPAAEARRLLDAFHSGILELGAPFELWGALAVPEAEAAEAVLEAGAAGVCLPAGELAGPVRLERLGPLLELLAARGAPLLVHPGPAPPGPLGAPDWWPSMTGYVAGMQAAWLAFAEWGRPAHPELKVVWAMLAGGAPLHAERLAARGGPAGALHDDRAWFDVSSYGPRAVDAMLRAVGVDRLVLGSDRPVIEPPSLSALGPAVFAALAEVNPNRVLEPVPLEA